MNSQSQPLVTIGLPVYNGEKYLRSALAALLAQDYSHFELIISDNNSNDSTEAVCREFAVEDSRIRYIRQAENHGAPWNFAFVLGQARGDYFMWAAHDDLWEPAYIRKCQEALQSHPEAVLCCTEVKFIDGEGNPSPYYAGFRGLETLGMTRAQRVHRLIFNVGWFAIYGLLRREALAKVKILGATVFGLDVVVALELMLMGHCVKVSEPLFRYRIATVKSAADQEADLNSGKNGWTPSAIPLTELAARLMQTIYQSELSAEEKTILLADFICTITSHDHFWYPGITRELLGGNAALSDSGFAFTLGQILGRSVPLVEIGHNPLMQALYRPPHAVPDVLTLAKGILGQPDAARGLPPPEMHRQALDLFQEGKHGEAARLLAEALKTAETSEIWNDWATAQLMCGATAESEAGYQRALELDPHNSRAAGNLGALLASGERTPEAIPLLERAARGSFGAEREQLLRLLQTCRAPKPSVAQAKGSPETNVLFRMATVIHQQSQAIGILAGRLTAVEAGTTRPAVRPPDPLRAAQPARGQVVLGPVDLNTPCVFLQVNGRPVLAATNERIVEIPFVHRSLPFPFNGRVLDVGCRESYMAFEVSALGFESWAVDIREPVIKFPGVRFLRADIRSSPFDAESFDVVIALSTIEHIGLIFYENANLDEEGDAHALHEIHRVLKPDGVLLLTVPFGRRGRTHWYRVYDHAALEELLAGCGFAMKSEDYW
ncbi:MAG: glycosyltransferase, partial [Terriglobia bacterium]